MSCGGNWDGNMPEENYCRNCRKVSLFVGEADGGWWKLVAPIHHVTITQLQVEQCSKHLPRFSPNNWPIPSIASNEGSLY